MSEDSFSERRAHSRDITEADLVLRDSKGRVVDDKAQARDISPAGFRAETRTPLVEGSRLAFTLALDDGDSVQGQVQVVRVSRDEWGWYTAGLRITRLSWRDKSRLRGTAYRPGYDFWGLAKKAMWALWLVVVVAAVQNIILEYPLVTKVFAELIPVIAALGVLAAGLLLLLRR